MPGLGSASVQLGGACVPSINEGKVHELDIGLAPACLRCWRQLVKMLDAWSRPRNGRECFS